MGFNPNAAKSGFHRNHSAGTMAIMVNGRAVQVFSDTGQHLIMPKYMEGQTGWENTAIPNPYLADQTQKYPLTAKLRDGDKTFIYSYLQVATSARNVANSTGSGVLAENLAVDGTVVTATALANTVNVTIAAGTVNQYAGGEISLYEATTGCSGTTYRIVGNTVRTSGKCLFTIDPPLNATGFTASATCRVFPNAYTNVRFPHGSRTSTANFEYLAGIWVASHDEDGTAAAEGDYAWIQTWGPCFCWAAVAFEGGTAWERDVYHQGGGDLQANTSGDAHPGAQWVGTMLGATSADPGVSTTGSDINNLEHVVQLRIEY